jgi:hypothetical protein
MLTAISVIVGDFWRSTADELPPWRIQTSHRGTRRRLVAATEN